MRVLQVLPYLERNGTERHAWFLARYLRRLGHTVTLAAPKGPMAADFAAIGVKHEVLDRLTVRNFMSVMGQGAAIANSHDLVHVHAAQEVCGGLRLAGCRSPQVFTAHCYHHSIDYAKAGWFLNPFCDRVIAVSSAEFSRLHQAGVRQLALILNGIDLLPFDTAARRKSQPAGSEVVAISVGRLSRPKAVHVVVRAMALVRSAIVLRVVGVGPEQAHLESLARRLGIDQRVQFLGRQDDLPSLLGASDFYVSATRREGLSLAAIEAMASGLPLVVSNLPEFDELVTDGTNGLLANCDDPLAFAQAMDRLATDAALRTAMGVASAAKAAKFSWERMAQETLEVYWSSLNPSAGVQLPGQRVPQRH